jgi:LmbE family N-acetylglucosaminyl deacetylase
MVGVPEDNQERMIEPDGSMMDLSISNVTRAVKKLVVAKGVTRVVTLGWQGGDGHFDHVATHLGAYHAAAALNDEGYQVHLDSLNASHHGREVVAANDSLRARKLAALALHDTQYDIAPFSKDTPRGYAVMHGFAINPATIAKIGGHLPFVMNGETYDRIISARAA